MAQTTTIATMNKSTTDAAPKKEGSSPKKKIVKKIVRRVVKKRPDGTIISSHLEPMDDSAVGSSTDATKSKAQRRQSAHAGLKAPTKTKTSTTKSTSSTTNGTASPERTVRRKSVGTVGLTKTKATAPAAPAASSATPSSKPVRRKSLGNVGLNSSKSNLNGSSSSGFMTPADFQAKAYKKSSSAVGVRNNFAAWNSSSNMNYQNTPASPSTPTIPFKADVESPSAKASFGRWGVSAKVPPPPPVSRGVSKTNSQGLSWMNGSLADMNAVQLRRYKQPALEIQAVVRGFLARRYMVRLRKQAAERQKKERALRAQREKEAAERQREQQTHDAVARIQSAARIRLAKQYVKKWKAAIVLQAPARRWIVQQNMTIPRLEYRLRMLEVERQEELQSIEEWKLGEQKRLWEKYFGKKKTEEKNKDQKVATLQHEAANIAHYLRSENKEMRVQVEHLRQSVGELGVKNKDLQRAHDLILKNMKELESALPRLEADQEKLQQITTAFEQKKVAFEATLQEGQEKWDMEQSIRALYELTAKEIVRMVGKSKREPNPNLIKMIKNAAARDFQNIEDAQKKQHERISQKFSGTGKRRPPRRTDTNDTNDTIEEEDEEDLDDSFEKKEESSPVTPVAPASPDASKRKSRDKLTSPKKSPSKKKSSSSGKDKDKDAKTPSSPKKKSSKESSSSKSPKTPSKNSKSKSSASRKTSSSTALTEAEDSFSASS